MGYVMEMTGSPSASLTAALQSGPTVLCCSPTQMMLWNMQLEWELHLGKSLPTPSCSDLLLSHGQQQVGHVCTASAQCQREGRHQAATASVRLCVVRLCDLVFAASCTYV